MSHPMTDDVVSAAISLVPRIRAAREESIVEQQMSALTQRLAHLEQAVRQWQCATMLSLIAMGALLLMGQALPKPRVIEAESFILKDTSGKIRGVLGAKPPTLSPTAHSGLGDYGLLLYASDGSYIAGLAERSNFGEAWLELYDKDTDSYASLVAGNGVAALNLKGTEQTREKAKREFEEWKKTDFSVSLSGGPTTQGNRMRPMKVFEI